MITKYKYSKNSIESVFNDLKLFEQNSYCYEYIRKKYDEIEEAKIKIHAEIDLLVSDKQVSIIKLHLWQASVQVHYYIHMH